MQNYTSSFQMIKSIHTYTDFQIANAKLYILFSNDQINRHLNRFSDTSSSLKKAKARETNSSSNDTWGEKYIVLQHFPNCKCKIIHPLFKWSNQYILTQIFWYLLKFQRNESSRNEFLFQRYLRRKIYSVTTLSQLQMQNYTSSFQIIKSIHT